jgi:phage/plasmid primase-like uncharacterized protein
MTALYVAPAIVVLVLLLTNRPCVACGRWVRHRLDCRNGRL